LNRITRPEPHYTRKKSDIALRDALMAAFALFSLQSPSLLALDQERTAGNVHQVCGGDGGVAQGTWRRAH